MKQIKNGFCDYYFLTEDGTRKKISLRTLYFIVFNKPYCKDNIISINGEVWKEIDNTNGLYFVSNMGRIKSYNGYEAILLKPCKTKNGYYRLDIIQYGERVSKLVHRLWNCDKQIQAIHE